MRDLPVYVGLVIMVLIESAIVLWVAPLMPWQ